MKKVSVIFLFLTTILYGCNNPSRNYTQPAHPPEPTPGEIVITNVAVHPNPYHLWPSTNFQAGNYSVVVSIMNKGEVTCASKLFLTLKVVKADDHGNFTNPEMSIGGATFSEGLMPQETKEVVIPIDAWLTVSTAQGDFDKIVGTYKAKVSMVSNDKININTNIADPLFEIVKGG